MYNRQKSGSLTQSTSSLTSIPPGMINKAGSEATENATESESPWNLLPLPYRRLVRLIFSSSELPVLFL